MSPPYPNTTHRRARQESPIPICNESIRSTSLLRIPEQLPSNRTPKNSAQAPYEKYKRIHSSKLPDAEELGDERRKQRIVPAGRKTVEHDESQPEREGGRGGCEDTGQPEGEDAGCGEEERQDKRVLPTEAVAGVTGKDATHGVDGVASGEKIATFGGGVAEDYGVGGNEGEGELCAGRLEWVEGQLRRLEDGCNELRLRFKAVISGARSLESKLTLFTRKTRQRLLGHKPEETRRQQRRGTSVLRPKRVRRGYLASPGLLRSSLLQIDFVALPRRLATRRSG